MELEPDNWTYILNDFNLTEKTSRVFSPIWFSLLTESATEISKHIANNLSTTVNVSVIINTTDCNNLKRVIYTTNSGITTIWTADATAVCNNLTTTGQILSIEPASASNVLSLEKRAELESLACRSIQNGFSEFGGLIGLIIIILVLTLIVGMLMNNNLDLWQGLAIGTLTIVFVVIINVFGAIIIGAMC